MLQGGDQRLEKLNTDKAPAERFDVDKTLSTHCKNTNNIPSLHEMEMAYMS